MDGKIVIFFATCNHLLPTRVFKGCSVNKVLKKSTISNYCFIISITMSMDIGTQLQSECHRKVTWKVVYLGNMFRAANIADGILEGNCSEKAYSSVSQKKRYLKKKLNSR